MLLYPRFLNEDSIWLLQCRFGRVSNRKGLYRVQNGSKSVQRGAGFGFLGTLFFGAAFFGDAFLVAVFLGATGFLRVTPRLCSSSDSSSFFSGARMTRLNLSGRSAMTFSRRAIHSRDSAAG